MMVQNWNSNLIVVKVVDNESREEFFIDPEVIIKNFTSYSDYGNSVFYYLENLQICLKF